MLFITITLSLILVALIVVALKKHQQRKLEDLADREQSLPPLDIIDDHHTESGLARDSDAASPAPIPMSSNQNQTDNTQAQNNWKQACKEFRQANRFNDALQAAHHAWPQSQSYEQVALTIRAAIKQTPRSDKVAYERWLAALHRAAAECSLLHDKLPVVADSHQTSETPRLSPDDVRAIELPWDEIGANELRLLTKTDRKLMTEAWGEPKQHVSAKAWRADRSHHKTH